MGFAGIVNRSSRATRSSSSVCCPPASPTPRRTPLAKNAPGVGLDRRRAGDRRRHLVGAAHREVRLNSVPRATRLRTGWVTRVAVTQLDLAHHRAPGRSAGSCSGASGRPPPRRGPGRVGHGHGRATGRASAARPAGTRARRGRRGVVMASMSPGRGRPKRRGGRRGASPVVGSDPHLGVPQRERGRVDAERVQAGHVDARAWGDRDLRGGPP